jgi:hypothetical protein
MFSSSKYCQFSKVIVPVYCLTYGYGSSRCYISLPILDIISPFNFKFQPLWLMCSAISLPLCVFLFSFSSSPFFFVVVVVLR